MVSLFRAVVERVKAVLVVRAAREIEADAIAHAAHRKTELLEMAARYETQGQGEVAAGCALRPGGRPPTGRSPGSSRRSST
jgi:hypothetical protein